MAKNSIRDYSATNSANTDIQSIDISEGCSPAGINNAIREVMADLKDVSTGAVALESPAMDSLTVDTTGIVYSGGNVGIGASLPATNLHIQQTGNAGNNYKQGSVKIGSTNGVEIGYNGIGSGRASFTSLNNGGTTNNLMSFGFGAITSGGEPTNNVMTLNQAGNVGIGTSSPNAALDVNGGTSAGNYFYGGTNNQRQLIFSTFNTSSTNAGHNLNASSTGGVISFSINSTERLRIDSSGNLLVGTTNTNPAGANVAGIALGAVGQIDASYNGASLDLNRTSTDGNIANFRRGGSVVGSIGVDNTDNLVIEGNSSHSGIQFGTNALLPHKNGAVSDNLIDLGSSTERYDDVFATNGTIQTSDANEKQQIAALTDAEMTAAKAIGALFKTFKWNSAVEAKGDAARTHAGVIAQDVQAAMTAAGLDAGNYAFFISSTWWETQTEVPAVEAVDAVYEDVVIPAVLDDDGNEVEAERTEQRTVTEAVEAVAAYTRTDTYDTAEEAPAGATERTRMGIRYPELLSFIGAATEQRLSNIETRLAALEAN